MLTQSALSGKTDAAKLSLTSRGSCQSHRYSRFRINEPGGGVRHCVARAKPGNVLSSTVLKSPGANTEIRWGTFLSKRAQLDDAIDEAVKKIQASFGVGAAPDLAIVMVSSVHGPRFNSIVPLLRKKLPSLTHIFGCSGYGVVGSSSDGLEALEGEPAFNLTLGQLPGVDVRVLHTLRSSIPPADATPEEWAEFVGVPHDSLRPVSFLLFAEPRFAQIKDLVAGLDYAFPNAPKIGAVLSTGTRSKSRAMFAWSANAPAAAKRRGTSASSSAAARLRARLAQSEGSTALSLRRSGYGLAGEPLDLPYRGGSRRSARAYPPAALRELQLDMMDNMLQGTEEEEEEEAGAAEEGDAQAGADSGKAEGRAGADQVVGGDKVGDGDNSADGKGKRDLGTAVSEQRAGSRAAAAAALHRKQAAAK
ncbi:FIST N domain-containing protein [Haematococcus lacustris]